MASGGILPSNKDYASSSSIASVTATNTAEDDDIFAEFEQDDDYDNIREKRMEQLRKQVAMLEEMRGREHGTYTEIPDEKEFFKITTKTKKVVVHFYHKEFRRCMIMDKHMETLCRKHFTTKFCKVSAEACGFLVEKLKIQILPCLISFIDGISVDRVVGFEELGNTDNFRTEVLERRLSICGVIKEPEDKKAPKKKTIFGFNEEAGDASEEEDD